MDDKCSNWACPTGWARERVRRCVEWANRTYSKEVKVALIQFSTGLMGALIGALAIVWVNARIMPAVQREQKLKDRQYDILAEIATISADYEQSIWNYFFSLTEKEPLENRRHDREQGQRASSAAQGAQQKLIIFFKDHTIASDWAEAMKVYGSVAESLGIEDITAEELEKRLIGGEDLTKAVAGKIRAEISQ